MATNSETPAADSEMAECDGEEVVTMMDVLKEQQDFEDDANAVLGGSDEKECTYSKGYIKRQAIYACLTCCPESKDDPTQRAGFCLACSLTCHENHDLVELYTKRNFRCDCGNPKFKTPCQFTPNKPELNNENIYNQNFIGLYCICNKPYGDQESTLDDEMIQCVVCEDWWHATHLDAVVPAPDQYAEMICKLCMAKNEFLHDYSDLTVNEVGDVDVVKVNGTATNKKLTNGIEEASASNDMETIATDAPRKTIPESNEANSTEGTSMEAPKEGIPESNEDNSTERANMDAPKEAIPESIEDNSTETESRVKPDKLKKMEVEPEKAEEIKSNVSLMDTEETDKAADILPEICTEGRIETITEDKTKGETSGEKAESTTSKEDTEECSATSNEKTEDSSVSSEEKTEGREKTKDDGAAATDKATMNVCEEKADNAESVDENVVESKEKDTSPEADSETTNGNVLVAEQSTEIMANENEVTKDQEKESNVKKEGIDINLSVEAETDKAKASETSQIQDEEMNDISKETEDKIVSEDSPGPEKDTGEVVKAENGDSKETSTNKIESESNENKVPELTSTENKRKMSTEDVTDDISVKKPKLADSKCLRPKGIKKVYKGATFWPATFRQKLCTCNNCISMYKDLSVLFLTDMEDTVFAYETLGKERTAGKPNQYEKGMEALCSLGRIQQIDALTEYNKMRDKLLTYLQSFKEKKEIVTENDIKTFFAGMKPKKRTDGVYFCG